MKKLLLTLILTLPFISYSQNWAPNGATWHYGFGVYTYYGYIKIESIGDTTINSIVCKKLIKTKYSQNGFPGQGGATSIDTLETEYTYADADKIYIYKHNQFYTLYDFSAQVGDTWNVPEIKHYENCDTIGTVKVDSIGTININGENLRYIWVNLTDTNPNWGWSAKIVERIGPMERKFSYDYLFPVKMDECDLEMHELIEAGYFRCYSDSTFNYSSNVSPSCDYITSIASIKQSPEDVMIFPNPSNGNFNIELNPVINNEIKIHDMLGKLLLEEKVNNRNFININNLKSGIYILSILDNNGIITTKKINCN
ncbi:MAG: T9SS type A sorting domain-containing protein [Bacteroidota bacterium]|nr:T9SS type A sorting domain-containing protein [Bacteroidota bacterium]